MKSVIDIVEEFSLKRQGKVFRGVCPICQAGKLELAVWDDAGKPRCHCFYGACNARELFGVLVGTEPKTFASPRISDSGDHDQRTARAKSIWNETISGQTGLVEKYLKGRQITVAVPSDIRLHPCLKHVPSGQFFPVMTGAIRDSKGMLRAIHRTYLEVHGEKARVDTPKMSLGPIQGCAIQLAQPAEILGLAEGIETALAAMQMCNIPTWSAISAGNLKEFVPPKGVKEIIIFADNGAPGEKAAKEAAAVFSEDGIKVRIAFPPAPFGDFNDLLMKGGLA